MKVFVGVSVVLCAVAVPFMVSAKGNEAEVGHYSGAFDWEQDYEGWGPACYYGQPVHVVYEAVNTWTYVVKEGDVRETLVQNGTAKIYDLDGNLLDTRPFHVTERFFDAGADVAIKHDYGTSIWYQVSHNWWDSNLEEYEYIWKIPGLYDFHIWSRSGSWSLGWRSGDCEGGFPPGWPPHPPFPARP